MEKNQQSSLVNGGIAGNIPVYFQPEEIYALVRLVNQYPTRPYPLHICGALEKLERAASMPSEL